jgi:hypothetical protein
MDDVDEVGVRCSRTDDGWACDVQVRGVGSETTHHVTVERAVLERLAPGSSDPTALVERSFRFLLEREAKESILRSFDLPLIGRYFPEYEKRIRAGD